MRSDVRIQRRRLSFASLGLACMLTVTAAVVTAATRSGASPVVGVSVVGNRLVDGSGSTVVLRGVNRSGTEYACVQGWGIFDGPSDAASVQAIASWHVNAVRLGLNEDCWLGINGVPASVGGAAYQQAIVNYVNLLNQNGMYAILELHWSAPGSTQATGQNPMPDQDHSPAFWSSVAGRFKSSRAVIFDLFNEPYPDNNQDTTAAWTCWKNGGSCPGVSYPAAGMQTLVNSVRGAGATNVIMLGGVEYANALDQWGTYKPADPSNQLAASFHTYPFNRCTTTACWNAALSGIGSVPLVTGEIGQTDGGSSYINSYMSWADAHGASYLAWVWDTWGCGGAIALITDYSGTPCPGYGIAFKSHVGSTATTPTTAGPATTTVKPITTTTVKPVVPPPPKEPAVIPQGYWIAARDGDVWGFGLPTYAHAQISVSPIVAMGAIPTMRGYWLTSADGAVYAYGSARSYGSLAGRHLNAPIVAMAPTASGRGYWLLAADGGVFTFGDARFFGSTGALRLAARIVDLSATPTGRGYRLVAADGGIFDFGDARFYGSTGGMRLAAPVVSMAPTHTGRGYWLIAADGGVFGFGDARYFGSLPGRGVRTLVARVRANGAGTGYWILSRDGRVYAFGTARNRGSVPGVAAVDIAAR